ncbi:MAG TPA: hypothetical protein VF659_18345 [Pyrinomonadaceae bacterium]|jgi:hypothetical protein
MRRSNSLTLLAGLALAAAVGPAATNLRGDVRQEKNNPARSRALEKAREDFYTVTDYDAPEPADPKERARQRVRRNRNKIILSNLKDDPRRFMITERDESSFGLPSSHAPDEPAIPAVKSDAVVVGSVADAQAYLTGDKTDIFSEFRVRLDDVIKSSTGALAAGDLIITTRGGGGVRFPSGKVIRYGHHGKPLPRVGRRYVLFLRHNNDGSDDYSIVTAYELRDGHVFPLDGVALNGEVLMQYAAYQKFKEADEAAFLGEVRRAVALSADQPE